VARTGTLGACPEVHHEESARPRPMRRLARVHGRAVGLSSLPETIDARATTAAAPLHARARVPRLTPAARAGVHRAPKAAASRRASARVRRLTPAARASAPRAPTGAAPDHARPAVQHLAATTRRVAPIPVARHLIVVPTSADRVAQVPVVRHLIVAPTSADRVAQVPVVRHLIVAPRSADRAVQVRRFATVMRTNAHQRAGAAWPAPP
jgi:hypothetical protein